MNKKVKYKNKCKIDVYSIEEFEKLDLKDVSGCRVLSIEKNGYIRCGRMYHSEPFSIFYNYADHKLESIEYLASYFENKKSFIGADVEKYPYKQYEKTIETNENSYKSIGALTELISDYVVILDELNIVIDAEDEEFERNTLNLLTYDPEIDYYSQSLVLAVQDDCKINEIQSLSFMPNTDSKYNLFIELGDYDTYNSVKYLNYYGNIEFYHNNVKLDLQ